MGKVLTHMTMSLDGFIADPDDQVGELFEWYEATCRYRAGDHQGTRDRRRQERRHRRTPRGTCGTRPPLTMPRQSNLSARVAHELLPLVGGVDGADGARLRAHHESTACSRRRPSSARP